MTIFEHIDRALRHLREGQRARQYQVAEEAGITKAMLSAYETGKQKPSLETLDKILAALGCDLIDLHDALAVFQAPGGASSGPRRTPSASRAAAFEPRRPSPWRRGPVPASEESQGDSDVYATLGIREPLDRDEEQALGEVLTSFHKLIRHIHRSTHQRSGRHDEEAEESAVPLLRR